MKAKAAFLGLVVIGAIASIPQSAAALPNGLPYTHHASNVEHVRWVCNPWGRCWWRPHYYRSYSYYPGPRFRPGPWGWRHRGWYRW
jgi:hypothetical protein